MGEVYRADDLKLGETVALKFLPETLERDADLRQRMLDETRIARRISHPNVCRVYDVGEVDGRLFLTMEFVDGEDLASLLRRIGRLPGDKAVQVARELCAGLQSVHDAGRLTRLLGVPASFDTLGPRDAAAAYAQGFALAGLDSTRFSAVAPRLQPRVFADSRAAWLGHGRDRGMRVRVEAAAANGRLVSWVIEPMTGLATLAIQYEIGTTGVLSLVTRVTGRRSFGVVAALFVSLFLMAGVPDSPCFRRCFRPQ